MGTVDPTIEPLPAPLYCAYHTATSVPASYVVDGTSVCAWHLPAQVACARAARRIAQGQQ